jgi:hypothetical protein
MCQPFGTNVTAVCRLPHAKAITGQMMLYLENFNRAAKCRQNRGPGLGGVMPLRMRWVFAFAVAAVCCGVCGAMSSKLHGIWNCKDMKATLKVPLYMKWHLQLPSPFRSSTSVPMAVASARSGCRGAGCHLLWF